MRHHFTGDDRVGAHVSWMRGINADVQPHNTGIHSIWKKAGHMLCTATQQGHANEEEILLHKAAPFISLSFSVLTLLVGRHEGHAACKKTER